MSCSRHRAWFAGNLATHAIFGFLGSVRRCASATLLTTPPGTGFSASPITAPWGMDRSGLSSALPMDAGGRSMLLATIASAWGFGWLDGGNAQAELSDTP